MNSFKNVILDLDGTLIDSSEGVVDAVNYSLRMMGEPEQPPVKITPFIGFSLEEMYPHFSDAPYAELRKHFQVRAAQTVIQSTRMLPGANEVVQELHDRGYRMAIASTKIRRHIVGILEKCGWSKLITVFAGGDEVEQVKPSPEILTLALSRMDAKKDETVLVGDTINDIHAAQAATMKVIAVNSPYGGRASVLASKPDYFVETIDGVLTILR
ncbi:MAG TPA: HAD-IA family hydrolase [candidate division Zixibacteria bacterium]|nr:HAD-IA family hydrolase [candidate division Zixibacteria bacterium]